MAKIYPSGWQEINLSNDISREIETLNLLSENLDDNYSIYHGVHWTRFESKNFSVYGEIDFAIVGPSGKLLLIEQKSGLLHETELGLEKKYNDKTKNIISQITRNSHGLQHGLHKILGKQSLFVENLLFCPDYVIKKIGSAGLPSERIVDATKKDDLIEIVKSILDSCEIDPDRIKKIHHYLTDVLEIVPEVNSIIGQTETIYTKLSGGLADWAQRIECNPFRLRVVGTAGSGKTQLAMSVYRASIKQGRKPLYVCYNRPLADHIASIAPEGGEIASYHQLADRIAKKLGSPIDYTGLNPFQAMEGVMNTYHPAPNDCFDDLIIDEGQDINQHWADNLLRLLSPTGKAWWLEDPMQNLYGRDTVDLKGWVVIKSEYNYRTPSDMLSEINLILNLKNPIQSVSPITGNPIDVVFYTDQFDLIPKTTQAIDMAIAMGYNEKNIAVLTYRGRESSSLSPYTQIGKYTLHAPQHQYDDYGRTIYSDGDIEIDSVHRFKGRASPCIIFTEIDFVKLDENAIRRIFVGATRATIKLIMVMSRRSKDVLLNKSN
jgi:hypothetical protein